MDTIVTLVHSSLPDPLRGRPDVEVSIALDAILALKRSNLLLFLSPLFLILFSPLLASCCTLPAFFPSSLSPRPPSAEEVLPRVLATISPALVSASRVSACPSERGRGARLCTPSSWIATLSNLPAFFASICASCTAVWNGC